MTHQHLSDEQLSAYLDGEPGDDASNDPSSDRSSDRSPEVEIDGCDTCRHRLAALNGARALVRQPVVPVSPSVRSAAVESAIAEVLGPETEVGTGTVRPLRRPSRSSPALLGAAAAVLLVVVGVSLGLSHVHNGAPVASSASPALTHPPAQRSAAVPGVTPGAVVPDLGSITSPSDLRSRVSAALAPSTDEHAPGNGSAFESQSAATSAAAPTGVSSAPENDAAGTPKSSKSLGIAASVPAALQTCESAAERAAGTTATPQLVATATYEHTPALVVVVHTAGSPATSTTAVVVAQTGCRVLTRTTI
jgi:hypothetical protein